MAVNMALKRAKKAQALARKRREEALESSLPARVLHAAQLPVQYCFLTESVFDDGMGTLVLARGANPYRLELASFLLDVFCLGVKDVMFESIEGKVFEMYMDAADAASPVVAVDPGYARKLLRDLVAWSHSIGFAPHRDFAAVERIFGDANADASDAVFEFGCEGRPFYIPGPTESVTLARRRIEHLRKVLGEGAFDFELAS
ncbi:hypothetical protein JQ628_31725 [Bradyrhizobium lablabi]|uniref:hypothetical protein n=1 Tax=Bradyrhizobium lablabi TaxID=722472 RepID=UPI001BAA77DA|nr:hypothetical protein [Bradyrhizobium lablabi]MBR1126130.1 hypothetical protein [Bradyrhizobium lablabi]